MSDTFISPVEVIARSVDAVPERPAASVSGKSFSYSELNDLSEHLRGAIGPQQRKFVGLAAHRSICALAGVWGILRSGGGYVPLNPKFPADRLSAIVESSEMDTIVLDPARADDYGPLLDTCPRRIRIVLFAETIDAGLAARWARHELIAGLASPLPDWPAPARSPAHYCYLLFTSGTTGKPKGIAITDGNVHAYLANIAGIFAFRPDDRFSNMFDLSFDLSVHDMFAAWSCGACLYVVPDAQLLAPDRFLIENEITVFFAVPSVGSMMRSLKVLQPGRYPKLRHSLFCGEALPEDTARSWQEASPNSTVDNLYGPTEATIAITHYRWRTSDRSEMSANGFVPIGRAFSDQFAVVVDEAGTPVGVGETGELWLAGSQLAESYFKEAGLTAEKFVEQNLSGDTSEKLPSRWYRTGDLAKRNSEGDIVFLGRSDTQVKIMGYRVELTEIESVLREVCGSDFVLAVPIEKDGLVQGVDAVVAMTQLDRTAIIGACRTRLPAYMVPRRVHNLAEFVLNANAKIDRRATRERAGI